MKNNYDNDLKKGSAGRGDTSQKQGVPGGNIGRGDLKQKADSSEQKSARQVPGSSKSPRELDET